MLPLANCEFWSGEAEVCVVNDNAGRMFEFRKLAGGETWATQEAIDHVGEQLIQRHLPGVPNPRFDQSVQPAIRALGSIKRTDLLVVGLHAIRSELDLSPLRVEGRAALYSFGFLLRRAASVLLDINEWELRVGLRVVNSRQGQIIGQIFLSDSLENGAGYCSHFAQPIELERLLNFVADPNGSFLSDILATHHSSSCQTSCPDCLRDYSNLAWHNILDWRMGLDVARLALDPNAAVGFDTPHWQPLLASASTSYLQALHSLGWTTTTLGSLPAARHNRNAEIIIHPLWNKDTHQQIVQARSDARANNITHPDSKTLFEILRRPF
jgi:hypothetical protein